MTTPIKSSPGSSGSSNTKGTGSGMQTPPPSSSSSTRRRGRPSKALAASSKAAALSPVSSPSKMGRYIKPLNQGTSSAKVDGTGVHSSLSLSHTPKPNASQPKTTPPSVKDIMAGIDIFDHRSSFMGDPPIGLPSFEEGSIFPSTLETDLFMHSDMGMGFGAYPDQMAFSFQYNSDFSSDCLPSINPKNLIFSPRTTSDDSSLFGGYCDETDVLSNSSQANEQPYQHQYNYSRKQRALEIERVQKCKSKILRRQSLENRHARHPMPSDHLLALSASASMAASLDNVASRRTAMNSRTLDTITPPPNGKHLKTKKSVMLLISPSGRAKTETQVMYDDSETEVDEATVESQSVDESMESDSSFDDPTPRGLGPGGKPYSATRKPKASGGLALGPPLGLFSTAPIGGPSQPSSWDDTDDDEEMAPSTRSSSARKPVVRHSGAENALHQTPRRSRRSFLDECILSSPKLPTPLKSSPGNLLNRPRVMSMPTFGGLKMDSSLHARGPAILDISDESEAETVVDENVPIPEPKEIKAEEGDALHALRNVVAKRRGSNIGM